MEEEREDVEDMIGEVRTKDFLQMMLSEKAIEYVHERLNESLSDPEIKGQITPDQISAFCTTVVEYTLYLRERLFTVL